MGRADMDLLWVANPVSPLLANGWLSKYNPIVKDQAKLYARYMDDILRTIKRELKEAKLAEINDYHPSLRFTMEEEKDGKLPVLDMLIIRDGMSLSSTWYSKLTDTGLLMNYHALAPRRYKGSVVAGFVYRIHRACSSWKNSVTVWRKPSASLKRTSTHLISMNPSLSKHYTRL